MDIKSLIIVKTLIDSNYFIILWNRRSKIKLILENLMILYHSS